MDVSIEIVEVACVVLVALGGVISVVIYQVSGPMVRVFTVDGLSFHCLMDSRGIRVVCNDKVVFATGGGALPQSENIDLVKSAKSKIEGKEIVVRYRGIFPRLAIFVDGRRVTSWPFARAQWWGRFLAVSLPVMCVLGTVAFVVLKMWEAHSNVPIGR
jgi:hypothetical protein